MKAPIFDLIATNQASTAAQPPFSVRIFDKNDHSRSQVPNQPPKLTDDYIQSLLPASYRTGTDESRCDVTAACNDVASCVKSELNLTRLHRILKRLWMVGRPTPPRPLYHQLLLSRDISLTESMDMHLVWTTGRVFLKPIPRFLFEPLFWNMYLASPEPCSCFNENVELQSNIANTQDTAVDTKTIKSNNTQPRQCSGGLRACALGFLFSYAALIMHESDFELAQEHHLLPREVTWTTWIELVKQLKTEDIYDKIDERFKYGELCLSRLNKIYCFTQSPLLLRPYVSHCQRYGGLLRDNFTWLASTTVYIAIVLTAMQVGSALDSLKGNSSFLAASYGFTIFAIIGPLVAAGLIVAACLVLLFINWEATLRFWRVRSSKVALWEPATNTSNKAKINAFV